MLTIRNDQLKILSSQQRPQFVDRLLPHLAEDYPSWYAERGDRGAREFVERVIDTGDKHGVRGQWAVSTLVDLMIEFGETFEKSPDRDWAAKTFAHASLPDRVKIATLSERLRERSEGRRIVEIEAGG